jgi:hypothetical protein
VLPEFKDRDEQAVRDKAKRIAPMADKVMARKPAEDHPPLPVPDYGFPAIPRSLADREGADGFHAWLDEFAQKTALGEDVAVRLANAQHTGE